GRRRWRRWPRCPLRACGWRWGVRSWRCAVHAAGVCLECAVLGPLHVDEERVEAVAGRHEKAVAMRAAKADIGAALGQVLVADGAAFAVVDAHAVEFLGGGARVAVAAKTAPEIALGIERNAIERTRAVGVDVL